MASHNPTLQLHPAREVPATGRIDQGSATAANGIVPLERGLETVEQPTRAALAMGNDNQTSNQSGGVLNATKFCTVISPIATDSTPAQDGEDPIGLRGERPRFRILVIGLANAGKTTLLQRVCNTTESSIIRNRFRTVIEGSVIEPTGGRGLHNIDDELMFSSNTAFVFHDSRGFEAGSVKELNSVREFISRRAAAKNLSDQLHAIWYCLPTDNDRPLSEAEMSFFQQGTGNVPVIAIFTKYDGMIGREYNHLKYDGQLGRVEANKLAPGRAEDLFTNSPYYLKRLQGAAHPPARYLRVQELHKPNSSCTELIQQTLGVLNSKILQLVFRSVQQNNISLSTQLGIGVIGRALLGHIQWGRGAGSVVENILYCYGHLFVDTDYGHYGYGAPVHDVASTGPSDANHLVEILKPAFPSLAGSNALLEILGFGVRTYSTPCQILRIGIATLIIAEDAFWLSLGVSTSEAFKLALDQYLGSARCKALIKKVDKKFYQHYIQDLAGNGEGVVKIIQGIVREHTVSQ